jgi:glycosyltransferase involved in cell wall biosynthesis
MVSLSVIICAHNPRSSYLSRTLEALRHQTLLTESWELLLVNNASRSSLARQWDLSWHPHARHVDESELGLLPARLTGIKQSSGDLLVFVDDDNVLDPSYLSEALRIQTEWPRLGVWGSGAIIPEFELHPVEPLKTLMKYLALREVPKARWSNVVFVDTTPWGAGLCVRATVADAYRRWNEKPGILITGRKGTSLLSGDDVEFSYIACELGFGIGIFPELRVTHLIPKERVSARYLLKVFEGTTASDILLAYKWKGSVPTSPLRPWGLLSILKNFITQRGLDRQMYFASLRAVIWARRMIELSHNNRSLPST